MDGIEAAIRIRALHPQIAIVFRSAYSDAQTLERARSASPFTVLDKTAPTAHVLRAVANAVPAPAWPKARPRRVLH